MHPAVRFVFVLHDHQPVGNFHDVVEGAYQKSYLPFLDLLQQHPSIRIALHTSGPLAEWLESNHPEYLDRLASLAAARQVEIVGGGVRIPKVQELLADFFKLDSVSALGVHLNGDEAMALGAAFRAANMSKAFRVGRAERSVGMIESSYFPIGLRLEELPEKIVEVFENSIKLWQVFFDEKTGE